VGLACVSAIYEPKDILHFKWKGDFVRTIVFGIPIAVFIQVN